MKKTSFSDGNDSHGCRGMTCAANADTSTVSGGTVNFTGQGCECRMLRFS